MKRIACLSVPAIAALLCGPAMGMTSESFDFDDGLVPAGATVHGDAVVRNIDGNPGGYLSLTDAINLQRGSIIFPDFAGGDVLSNFKIEADLRIGGGTSRPADGISFNLVRPGDPVLGDGLSGWADAPGGFGFNMPEEGATTGLSVALDEWFSGDPDLIGISIRVDNVLIDQIELPTLHGAVDDITSLQTGPSTGDLDDLGWAGLSIVLASDQTLTVSYKDHVYYSDMIAMAPIAGGQLVIGSRTGGFNSNHDVDNVTFMANMEDPKPAIPEPVTAALGVMGVAGVLGSATRRGRCC